ncbi:hypothetical protein [Kistimonas asteriae]|uniref:hypothetical protein n=1 Tax=Kistimonas asteriae TaxID=517724 RepID=UPI001BA4F287|nr:hypothetical protein [Kistimonas asteriae]
MDPLRAQPIVVPGFDDVNLKNQQGKNWIRTIRKTIADLYMQEEDDGQMHLNRKLAAFTLSTATAACTTFACLYKGVSLYTQYSNDPDSVSQEEVQAIAWSSAFCVGGLFIQRI